MYKRLFCLFFMITTLIACSFSAFGDEVVAEPVDYKVILTAYSYQSGRYFQQTASPDTVYQVAPSDSGYVLGTSGIAFQYNDTTAFVPGANYVMKFIFVTPQQSINLLEGTTIGQLSGAVSDNKEIVIGSNCTVTTNFDRSLYPDTFNYSDYLDYDTQAYLVTYTFSLEPGDSYFVINFDFDIASKNYTYFLSGFSHLSIKTTQEDFNNGILLNINYFLDSINKLLGDILFNLKEGFNAVNSALTSLSTTTSDGFAGVLASLSSMQTDINNGFESLGDKLDKLNDTVSDAVQGDIEQAVEDLNKAEENMQQGSEYIKNEQSDIDSSIGEMNNQFDENEKVQDDFLSDYNLGGVNIVTGYIYSSITEYVEGIKWVGSFFGEVLTFEPFASLLYIIVFINLLFVLVNTASRPFGAMVRRNSAAEKAETRAETRARVSDYTAESRSNTRSMFNHYGFTR